MRMLLSGHIRTKHGVSAKPNAESDIEFPDHLDMSCNECSVIFKSWKHSKFHYSEEHNIANGYVKCCDRKLKYIPDVKDHIEWHSNPNAFW